MDKPISQYDVCPEPIHHSGLKEQLEYRKQKLEADLRDVQTALMMLEEHPGFAETWDAIKRIGYGF